MTRPPIDTRLRQETPEGVELTLSPAGPAPRALAWLVDFALRAVVYLVGGIVLGRLGGLGKSVGLIGAFLMEWGYPVYFELRRGATPGKRLLSLRVVQDDGAPLTLPAALLRNLLRFVDFLPVGYLLGVLTCLISARFQRLGDLAAGTLVVHKVDDLPRALPESAAPRPPLLPLTLDEQRAIVAYAERAGQWSEQRRAELAEHSGEATRGAAHERVQQLLGYARWIAGER